MRSFSRLRLPDGDRSVWRHLSKGLIRKGIWSEESEREKRSNRYRQ